MANARGDRAIWTMRRQADFTTAEAAGDGEYYKLPFYSINAAAAEELSPDDALTGDALPPDAIPGLRSLSGDVEVPLGVASLGWHLRGLFGAPATTGAGDPYTHVFTAKAAPALAHHTACVTHPQAAAGAGVHFHQVGITHTEFSLSARKDGQRARARFGLIGFSETKGAGALDTTPVEFADDPTPIGFQGVLFRGAGQDAAVTAAEFRVASGVTPDQETLNGLATPAALDEGKWEVTGSLTARFRDAALYDAAEAGTLQNFELRYILSASRSAIFRVHNARLERTGIPVQGGDVISATFNFRAGRPGPGDSPFIATLKNGVANYDNPA